MTGSGPPSGPDAEPADAAAPDGALVTGADDVPTPSATAPGLLRASSVMAAGTVVSRALGFVRAAVLAAAIGTALTGDAFQVANTVPNIVYILLAGGVLNAVFVPQLVRAMQAGPEHAQEYTDRLLTLAVLVLAGITALVTLAAPLVVGLYTVRADPAAGTVRMTAVLAYWSLPQVFFYGLYTMLSQVLNARGSFGPMMWAPVVNNLIAIATGVLLLAAFDVDPQDPAALGAGAVALLAGGATVGVAAQALVLVPVLARTGFRFRVRLDPRGVGLRRAGRLARWTLLFVLVNQLAYAVVVNLGVAAGAQAAAEGLRTGIGILAYSNAYLIFILPHSVITVSVMTGLLPRLSQYAATGDLAAVRAGLGQAWRLTGVGVVAAATGLVALGPDLTTVLFDTPKVTTAGARYIGLVAGAFALGLPAFSAQYVTLRGFYAFEDTRTPFLLQVVIAATNVILALGAYAVLPLRWRMLGVALAYSVTYLAGLALSVAALRRRTGGLAGTGVLRHYVRLVVAALPAGLLGWLVARLVTAAAGAGPAGSLAAVVVGGAVLLAVYAGLARTMRVRELSDLLGRLSRRPSG